MSLKMLSYSKRASALILSCLAVSCSSWTSPPNKNFSAPPVERVLAENYDLVWKSVQLAMAKYPMKVSDYDSGLYETQSVRGEKAWNSPNTPKTSVGGQRYRITIKLIRGKTSVGQSATKITILKLAELQRDFFSEFEKLPSDGLEEKAIMYRVEREIQIQKALSKVPKD